MKSINAVIILCTLSFAGIVQACNEKESSYTKDDGNTDIAVESVEWNNDLKDGYTLYIDDKSLNVANRMSIIPENATHSEQIFSSSDEAVATVSKYGQVTPASLGETEITVTAGGVSDAFTLTVIERAKEPEIAVTEIRITEKEISISLEEERSIAGLFSIIPENATDRTVTYSTDNEDIVTVSQHGVIKGIREGNAAITVASGGNPEIKNTFNVTVIPFYGDYPRKGWTASINENIGTFIENKDGTNINIVENGIFDENYTTFLGLVKPGKAHGRVTVAMNPSVEDGGCIYFIVDMKEARTVNYFRLRHRQDTFLRWWKFSKILGSSDGKDFTVIAENIEVTDCKIKEKTESPDISFPETTCRYLKFYADSDECWDMAKGNSVQITELYIGRKKQ